MKRDGCCVVGLEWENVFLHIRVESDKNDLQFFLIRRGGAPEACIPLRPDSLQDGVYHFQVNICQLNGRSFLDNGDWYLVSDDGAARRKAVVSLDVGERFDELSRVFPYEEGKAYLVTFPPYTDEKESSLIFALHSSFVKRNDNWKRRHTGAAGAFLYLSKDIYQTFFSKGGQGKNVLFLSQTSDRPGANLSALIQRMTERGLDQDFHVTCRFHDDVTNGVSKLELIKLARLIGKQDFIFVDNYIPILSLIDLPKGTKMIQVWHAGIGFKAVGYCRFGKSGSPHPSESSHRKYTTAAVPSEEAIPVFREVFAIEEEAFLPTGMPRLDGYYNPKRVAASRNAFFLSHPEWRDKKIILFAPTYRGSGQAEAYYDYGHLNFQQIREVCGDKWIFLIKMHPFVKEAPPIPDDCRDVIFDMSDVPDINDLFYVTDLLITDYSSAFYDYAGFGRPILFYTYDRRMYQLVRGVHRGVKETAPGKVCDTFEELIRAIREEDFELEKTKALQSSLLRKAANGSHSASDAVLECLFRK